MQTLVFLPSQFEDTSLPGIYLPAPGSKGLYHFVKSSTRLSPSCVRVVTPPHSGLFAANAFACRSHTQREGAAKAYYLGKA